MARSPAQIDHLHDPITARTSDEPIDSIVAHPIPRELSVGPIDELHYLELDASDPRLSSGDRLVALAQMMLDRLTCTDYPHVHARPAASVELAELVLAEAREAQKHRFARLSIDTRKSFPQIELRFDFTMGTLLHLAGRVCQITTHGEPTCFGSDTCDVLLPDDLEQKAGELIVISKPWEISPRNGRSILH
jgi:hypothetical protein